MNLSKCLRVSVFVVVCASGLIMHTTHAMFRGLVAATAGDICLLAAFGAEVVKRTPLEERAKLMQHLPPSAWIQLYNDAHAVSVYTPYLVPAGLFLSPVGRCVMVARASGVIAKTGALTMAGLSVPGSIVLISTFYTLRLEKSITEAGLVGNVANKIWNVVSGKPHQDRG